mmetsp:Transcript_1112/g.3044  ORF Transcript_1112/g.3044 Transcript_1112/m.3044 type:complete len:274 (+) Transcript_1112:279-1100(+)
MPRTVPSQQSHGTMPLVRRGSKSRLGTRSSARGPSRQFLGIARRGVRGHRRIRSRIDIEIRLPRPPPFVPPLSIGEQRAGRSSGNASWIRRVRRSGRDATADQGPDGHGGERVRAEPGVPRRVAASRPRRPQGCNGGYRRALSIAYGPRVRSSGRDRGEVPRPPTGVLSPQAPGDVLRFGTIRVPRSNGLGGSKDSPGRVSERSAGRSIRSGGRSALGLSDGRDPVHGSYLLRGRSRRIEQGHGCRGIHGLGCSGNVEMRCIACWSLVSFISS